MYLELNLSNASGYIVYSVVEDTVVVHSYSYETETEHTREQMKANILSHFEGFTNITFCYRADVWAKDYNNLLI